MKDILELARQLGKQIAEDPRGTAFQDAQKSLAETPEAQKLLREFNESVMHIQSLESQHQPVEPEHKQKLAEIQQHVAVNPCLANYAKVQADYVELMQQVSAAIENPG